TNLDLFLVFVCRLVDRVIALGLEDEVSELPTKHGDEPANQRRHDRIGKQEHIAAKKSQRAYQMQRLVDAAVVVITMIVPALLLQSSPHATHRTSLLDGYEVDPPRLQRDLLNY